MPVVILLLSGLGAVLGVFAVFDTLWFSTAVRWPPLRSSPHHVVIVDLPMDGPQTIAALSARLRALGARATLVSAETNQAICGPEVIAGQALRYRDFASAACGRMAVAGPAGQYAAMLSPDFSIATSSSIPRLDIAHLEDTAFARQIVRGKTVLLVRSHRQPVYVTPMHRKDGLLSAAVFEALMVESMLRKRPLRWAYAPAEFAFSAAFLALLLWWGRRKPNGSPILRSIAVAGFALLVNVLLLRLWGWVVPVGSTLAALAGMALLAGAQQRQRIAKRLHALQFVLQQATHRSDRGGWRSDLDTEQSIWTQLNALAVEHFGARRSAMLSLPPGKVEMEVADLHAEHAQTIIETRRDHRVAPYDSALAQGRPTATSVPFFAPPQSQDGPSHTVIAALSHAGETVGFWVLEVGGGGAADVRGLIEDIAVYADAFARSLYRARHPVRQHRQALPDAPTLESRGHEAAAQIAAYRSLYAALRHPTAVLDPHGRIQFSNTAFGVLARTSKQPLLSMPLSQMMQVLCGLSHAQVQVAIRGMMAGQRGVSYPVALSQLPMPLTLHAYPVSHNAARAGGGRESGLQLDLTSIVLELLPADGKEDLLARFNEYCERIVATTSRALDDAALTLQRQPDAVSSAAAETLAEHLFKARSSLAQFEQQIRAQRALDHHTHLHCNLRATLDLAIHGAHEALSERRIVCRVQGLEHLYAAADPETVRALLDDALALLIQDAVPDSDLFCEIARGAAAMVSLCNTGFGVPDWHLQEAIAHAGTSAGDDPLRQLLGHTRSLEASHGRLWVSASLGEGYEIVIEFPAED